LGKPRHLIEVVDRVEAAETLAVRKQPGRLGDGEVLRAELVEADRVEVDRCSA